MHFPFPAPFEDRMKSLLKEAWTEFAAAHTSSAPVSIRLNPNKNNLLSGKTIPWATQGYYLEERPNFTLDPLFHAGTYYVQEASSMLLEQVKQLIDTAKPLRVLDLCAAPGGKSTHLLSILSAHSLLVSNEVIRTRAQILAENMTKWGHANVMVTNNDPEAFQKLPGFFDVIVVDAPCSGEGLFRKDPDALQEWSPENTVLCSQRQRRILKDVWPALKENGILVYCTCTYNPEENENNLAWFSQQHKVEFLNIKLGNWNLQPVKNGYQLLPHRVVGEGFFISFLRKKEAQDEIKVRSLRKLIPAPNKVKSEVCKWMLTPQNFEVIQHDNLLIAIPAIHIEAIEFLSHSLHVISKGTALAEIKHDKLIPEHAIALSIHLDKHQFSQIELSLERARSYLRKETLTLDLSERGFALVTHKNIPLGWINRLGNRINNLYPIHWRIRIAG